MDMQHRRYEAHYFVSGHLGTLLKETQSRKS